MFEAIIAKCALLLRSRSLEMQLLRRPCAESELCTAQGGRLQLRKCGALSGAQ